MCQNRLKIAEIMVSGLKGKSKVSRWYHWHFSWFQ